MSPAPTGSVMQAVSLAAPFVLGGGLKIVTTSYSTGRPARGAGQRARAGGPRRSSRRADQRGFEAT